MCAQNWHQNHTHLRTLLKLVDTTIPSLSQYHLTSPKREETESNLPNMSCRNNCMVPDPRAWERIPEGRRGGSPVAGRAFSKPGQVMVCQSGAGVGLPGKYFPRSTSLHASALSEIQKLFIDQATIHWEGGGLKSAADAPTISPPCLRSSTKIWLHPLLSFSKSSTN